MTYDDDAAKLHEISRELPAIDVDGTCAERIAFRARQDVGRGPSIKRLIEPTITAIAIGSYAVWAILKVLEALR